MRRTRSLRKMKLPLRRPSTSSSPSGYAAVISWPSSRTRRAIVPSSKTIRLSSRPPVCLRFAILGNIHSHRRGSGPREIGSTPADSGDPENRLAAHDDRVLRPIAAWHARVHQQPPYRPMPDTAERYQRIPRAQGPNFPRAPSPDPRRPVTAGEPLGRRLRRPLQSKLAKLRAPSLVIRLHLHNLPNLPTLPRAVTHADPVKRHLRHPRPAERLTPSPRAPGEPCQLPRPLRAQHQAGAPGRGPQHGHRQCVIIARHHPPGNVEAVLVHPEIEIGQVAEHAVPRASLECRGPSGACHVLARARA